MKEQVEYRVRHVGDEQQSKRAGHPPHHPNRAHERDSDDEAGRDWLTPRPEKRIRQRVERHARLSRRPQHHDTGEVLAGLRSQRRCVVGQAAARDDQRNAPRKDADRRGRDRRDAIARAQPRPRQHERQTEERQGQQARLRSNADRQAGDKPTPRQRPQSAGSGDGRGDERLRGDGRGKAGHVAERPKRREPEERRRDGDDSGPPRNRRGLETNTQGLNTPACNTDREKKLVQKPHERCTRDRAPDRQAARFRRRHAGRTQDRRRRFAKRDEDGISGRMRLVLRDVEVGDAQGEVDGVDVFEGRRQERNVGREEHQRERRNRFPHESG